MDFHSHFLAPYSKSRDITAKSNGLATATKSGTPPKSSFSRRTPPPPPMPISFEFAAFFSRKAATAFFIGSRKAAQIRFHARPPSQVESGLQSAVATRRLGWRYLALLQGVIRVLNRDFKADLVLLHAGIWDAAEWESVTFPVVRFRWRFEAKATTPYFR